MPRAVLIHGCGPSCTAGSSLLPEVAPDSQVFVLSGKLHRDLASRGGAHVHVLDGGSTAERVFRFKQRVDLLDLNTVTVLTSPRGRGLMTRYQQLLFTAVYTFEYKVDDVTCPGCTDPAHSPGEGVEEEVRKFLQQLPALRGGVTVLTSTLIPDTFGHGFSTREGGVSYIPNLSSLNLFSSSRRRDPVAVVTENRRRLAVRGGFHPKPLHLVKVNHASDVWVMSKAQPDSYDAIVTDQSGVVVAAPGADCMTLLFTDPVKKVGGVAHAGKTPVHVQLQKLSCSRRSFLLILRLERDLDGRRHGDSKGHGDRVRLPDERHLGGGGAECRGVLFHPGQTGGAAVCQHPSRLCRGSRFRPTARQHPPRQQAPPTERRDPARTHPRRHGDDTPPCDALHFLSSSTLLLSRQRRSPLWNPGGFPVDPRERGQT
uniref:purine nucleoside phosphorylase LACC1 isoform X1 n=1 Tax=Solea senegalensis TaxID=28829 RepID=UPI001CD84854|nr:purine nucleoside phosphorylase LACC1 isoform X1 [Solea senegalensis]